MNFWLNSFLALFEFSTYRIKNTKLPSKNTITTNHMLSLAMPDIITVPGYNPIAF